MDKVVLCGINLAEWESFAQALPAEANRTVSVFRSALPLTISRVDIIGILNEIDTKSIDIPDSAFIFFVELLKHAMDQTGGMAHFDIEEGEAQEYFTYVLPDVDLRKDIVKLNAVIAAEQNNAIGGRDEGISAGAAPLVQPRRAGPVIQERRTNIVVTALALLLFLPLNVGGWIWVVYDVAGGKELGSIAISLGVTAFLTALVFLLLRNAAQWARSRR